MDKGLDLILEKLNSFEKRFEQRFDKIEERMDRLEERMDSFEEKMDRFEERLDKVEEKLSSLDVKVGQLENEVKGVKSTVYEHTKVLKALEHRVDVNSANMVRLQEDMNYVKGEVAGLKASHKELTERLENNYKATMDKLVEIDDNVSCFLCHQISPAA